MSSRRSNSSKLKEKVFDDDSSIKEMTIEEIQEQQDAELDKYNHGKRFFENTYYYFTMSIDITCKTIKFIIKASGVYLLWIILHYVASHLYVKLCVPNTLIGFLISPFMVATPHCQGIRWIVYNAANIINNMWILMGAWICSALLIINNDNTHDNTHDNT
jgi:hypothetical protein